MSRTNTIAVALLAGTAALGLTGCGGGQAATPPPAAAAAAPAPAAASPTAPRRVELRFQGGQVQGGLNQVDVPVGTPVTFVISSDVAEQAHLHGYDREVEIAPGTPATIAFTADTAGVFDLELHHSDKKLARLEVR